MMPVGPLMTEHRVIEQVIRVIAIKADSIAATGRADPVWIDTVVDFIRVYADRTHHGKEEDILFRDLAHKDLADEDRRIMNELIAEHKRARQFTGELVQAKERYLAGDPEALAGIVAAMQALAALYPPHIAKEDKGFFIPVMRYFTPAEQAAMIAEMEAFDRKMIHEKYRAVATRLRE